MTLEQAENEIAAIYRWFAQEAPGVTVREEGHLANLWAVADAHYEKESA
jgi:hypothetical protein